MSFTEFIQTVFFNAGVESSVFLTMVMDRVVRHSKQVLQHQ